MSARTRRVRRRARRLLGAHRVRVRDHPRRARGLRPRAAPLAARMVRAGCRGAADRARLVPSGPRSERRGEHRRRTSPAPSTARHAADTRSPGMPGLVGSAVRQSRAVVRRAGRCSRWLPRCGSSESPVPCPPPRRRRGCDRGAVHRALRRLVGLRAPGRSGPAVSHPGPAVPRGAARPGVGPPQAPGAAARGVGCGRRGTGDLLLPAARDRSVGGAGNAAPGHRR